MSHYDTIVLIPKETEDVDGKVEELLEPYDCALAPCECPDCCEGEEPPPADLIEPKWDWWVVGGRWSGFLRLGYDPARDPANLATCRRCHGCGWDDGDAERSGKEGLQGDAVSGRPRTACLNCEGTGRSLTFPYMWRCEDDVVPAARLLSLLERDLIRGFPFAVVTPDGKWHEHGRMPFYTAACDRMVEDEWREQVMEIVGEHLDCLAVVCDMHV